MLACEPGLTFPFSLKSDLDKPEASRPIFFGRINTAREWGQAARLWAQGLKLEETEDEKALDLYAQAIAVQLVDWKNVVNRKGETVAFDPTQLPDLLDVSEFPELYLGLRVAGQATAADKKKIRILEALLHGRLCKRCTSGAGGECVEKPSTAFQPAIRCTSCEGAGCDECLGRGKVFLARCPYLEVDDETSWIVGMVRHALASGGGNMPVAGGMLDQAQSFLDLAQFVKNDEAMARSQ